jgi:gas vesicle structural protein
MPSDFEPITLTGSAEQDVSLLDIIEHVLNAGVVIHGSLVISGVGVDLVHLGLNVVLTSVETALRNLAAAQTGERRAKV